MNRILRTCPVLVFEEDIQILKQRQVALSPLVRDLVHRYVAVDDADKSAIDVLESEVIKLRDFVSESTVRLRAKESVLLEMKRTAEEKAQAIQDEIKRRQVELCQCVVCGKDLLDRDINKIHFGKFKGRRLCGKGAASNCFQSIIRGLNKWWILGPDQEEADA